MRVSTNNVQGKHWHCKSYSACLWFHLYIVSRGWAKIVNMTIMNSLRPRQLRRDVNLTGYFKATNATGSARADKNRLMSFDDKTIS